jgi:Protein of unknown function (DUF4238)
MSAQRAIARQEAHRHHFVPQFLLRPWCINGVLQGYCWDSRNGKLACKCKGPKGFCYRLDLLALRARNLGRDALEKIQFGQIDTKGAAACDQLLTDDPKTLSADQRCDFARLLFSLEARRPANVNMLRVAGPKYLAECLDSDPEILAAMDSEGLANRPMRTARIRRSATSSARIRATNVGLPSVSAVPRTKGSSSEVVRSLTL